MLDKKSDIASEIGSRICHDLISPIGAISNGIELLELTGAAQSPEMVLIADSVRAANGKIRFLRIAFGDASGGTAIGTSEITDILAQNYSDNRLHIDWRINTALNRQNLKTCFLTLMCLENTLPHGGNIAIMDNSDGWQLDAIGDQIKTDGIVDLDTQNFCTPNGPASVHYKLLQKMIADFGYHLEFTLNAQSLSILIKP